MNGPTRDVVKAAKNAAAMHMKALITDREDEDFMDTCMFMSHALDMLVNAVSALDEYEDKKKGKL